MRTLGEAQRRVYNSIFSYEPESAQRYLQFALGLVAFDSQTTGKKVVNITTGTEFKSIRKAAESLGMNHSALSRAIVRGKPINGQYWEIMENTKA
jgi:hypothetical protein